MKREKLNCPNCGAPITETECPYCGTVFYDFTVLDSDKPSYIRMNWHGNQIVFRAIMRAADIEITSGDPISYYVDNKMAMIHTHKEATASIEFMILEDDEGVLFKRRELKEVMK